MSVKLLAFAGSLRRDSWNKKVVKVMAASAEKAGAEVQYLDLKDYPMPIYDEDVENESGIPEQALQVRSCMKAADGFLISVPEYNGAISAALKNVIDWASRPREGEAPLECFKGKVCGLAGASPGALGGIRGLPITRQILSGIGMIVVPQQAAIGAVHEKFNDAGAMTDERFQGMLDGVAQEVVRVAGAVR